MDLALAAKQIMSVVGACLGSISKHVTDSLESL
jgi:hypothetical protein